MSVNHIFKDVWHWVEKHWFIVLLMALLFYLAGTLLFYLFTMFKRIGELATKFFPPAVAAKVAVELTKIYNAVAAHTWIFIVLLIVIFPPLGWALALWSLLDLTKSTPTTATTTTDLIPTETPGTTLPDFSGYKE